MSAKLAGLIVVVGLAAGAALLLLPSGEAPPGAGRPMSREEPVQAASEAPARARAAKTADGSSVVEVEVELDDPETLARLQRIAGHGAELARRPPFEQVLADGRARGPVDLRVALEGHLRERPEDFPLLLTTMEQEGDRLALFAMARVLGRGVADPDLRRRTVELLRRLDPERQQVALVALLGRTEPEVVELGFELLERGGSDGVRARAASTLAHVLDELAPLEAERARTVARGILTSASVPPPLTAGAAELLGTPAATAADVALLRDTLGRAPDGATYSSVAQSLALTGSTPDALRAQLRATAADEAQPPEVRETARKLLAGAEAAARDD